MQIEREYLAGMITRCPVNGLNTGHTLVNELRSIRDKPKALLEYSCRVLQVDDRMVRFVEEKECHKRNIAIKYKYDGRNNIPQSLVLRKHFKYQGEGDLTRLINLY